MIVTSHTCRQYEERELQAQEDRAKRRMDFDNQKMRLQNQLEFEKTKDTYGAWPTLILVHPMCVIERTLVYMYVCTLSLSIGASSQLLHYRSVVVVFGNIPQLRQMLIIVC